MSEKKLSIGDGIEVIDNFLSDLDFMILKNNILNNPNFLWQFNPCQVGDYDILNHDERVPFQFVHGMYRDSSPTSKYFDTLNPFIRKLNPQKILRIKVNLNTRTERIIEGEFHVDWKIDHKVGIFYLNTNNGYTIFKNGKKVNSVKNRMVLFDGSLSHAGTNCTDKQRRVVINFNYI